MEIFKKKRNQYFENDIIMKNITIINGVNLNLIGKREPHLYGNESLDDYFEKIKTKYSKIELEIYHSNHEGKIVDILHMVGFNSSGIVLNAGAYTHTSIAIHDAIKAINAPVIEVHITNIYAREKFRNYSYISSVCKGCIIGFGLESYNLAIDYFLKY